MKLYRSVFALFFQLIHKNIRYLSLVKTKYLIFNAMISNSRKMIKKFNIFPFYKIMFQHRHIVFCLFLMLGYIKTRSGKSLMSYLVLSHSRRKIIFFLLQ